MELPDIIAHRAASGARSATRPAVDVYPEVAGAIWTPASSRALGEEYLERTRIHRKTGRAVLHRQDAEQLAPRRPDPADPAEREDHRRAPASAGLLLLRLQAAFRPRPGLHLRPRRHRPLLPRLRRADGAFRRGPAGPRPPRDLRADGRGHRRRRCGAARLLRPALRRRTACASTRTSAPCAPPAPSRCASRSSATPSTIGAISSLGSAR